MILYYSSKPVLKIEKSAVCSNSSSEISSGSSVPVDVVLWNAWIDKCARLVDMDDTAYKHYVCIEPGCVSGQGQVVPPNGTLTLQQKLSVLKQE